MTHTLHEQYITIDNNDNFMQFLQNELGFINDGTQHFYLKPDNPYLKHTSAYQITNSEKSSSIGAIIAKGGFSQSFYYQNSFDLSVRYLSSTSVDCNPLICAEDINGDWMFLTQTGCCCGNNQNILKSRIISSDEVNVVDTNCSYTITKIARPDNGVPFKGLYIVNSAQFFTPHETLVNIDGEIYKLISLAQHRSATQYPTLAFKVSDE